MFSFMSGRKGLNDKSEINPWTSQSGWFDKTVVLTEFKLVNKNS